jgi:hypothetical protein
MSITINFASKGQIAQQPTAVICQVMSERNVFLLLTAKLSNSHFNLQFKAAKKINIMNY